MSDVALNKINIIERCLKRIHEEYEGNPDNLTNYTKQDSIILNLQRACEAAINLAMNIVSRRQLGLPQYSRDAFHLLEEKGILSSQLAKQMKGMIGFQNIAVHEYQDLDLDILQKILDNHLEDFVQYTQAIMKQL